jgi:glycosyltransferase involved in cell wall biosynthesis
MIVVNARFLTQPCSGVQRFASQISHELSLIRDDLVFVIPPKPNVWLEYKFLKRIEIVGNFSGHLWEQLDLPQYIKSLKNPLLLNLASTAPIFVENQIVTHHDITYIRHPEAFSRSFIALYRFLVPRFLKRCSSVVTVSEFSKKEISSFWKIPEKKISVIPNAVAEHFQCQRSELVQKSTYFLAIGSQAAHKNLSRLVNVFNQYSSSTDCSLKIIGGEASSFRHQNYSAINSKVEFLGRVGDSEMIDLLCHAKALIFPSLYEGFGIPPLEAQACGVPVIASDIPAVREVLLDSAIFFDPLSVSDLMQAIRRVDQDADLRTRLSIAGLENVKRFSWSVSARMLSDLIDQILNN